MASTHRRWVSGPYAGPPLPYGVGLAMVAGEPPVFWFNGWMVSTAPDPWPEEAP